MRLGNVHWEWDKLMSSMNRTIQCALGMGISNVCWEETSQCALGMGLANVPWKWDYPMCPGNETSQ